ncbi:extracellular solute-binding protein [Couchioplanes caeruleus]|uniref:extracellular solute-binding protein n=1 Tax=Couchioplanes caeruleus TaxID=56438 RepID=UPI0020C163C4|nr:extracellular solute-binding protein [Couchioplanes caeruleus]UQU68164.1 extracellular solute-binding protein [Couchioplanes caeruleus]
MRIRGKPWWLFAAGNLTGAAVAASLFLFGPFAGPPELEPGELVVLSGQDDSTGGQRQHLIDLWNDSHPGNRARIVTVPQDADGQWFEMANRAEDGDTDIFNLDVAWTAYFADPPSGRRLIRPIDEELLTERPGDAFMAKPLQTCRYEGRLWALPFNTDAGLLYYRTDQQLKPPFTWPAIEAAAGRAGFEGAYTGQLARYEGLTVNVLEAVWAAGGRLDVAADGRVSLDLDRWDEAVRRLTPRRDAGPHVVLPESTSFDETGSRVAFQDGRVLFMRNWPVAYRTMLAGDQPQAGGAGGEQTGPGRRPVPFAVTKLPGPSVLGGQNLAISERTKKPRAAQALIEFLTNQRSQEMLFDPGGFAATRAAVYENETIKQKYPYAPLLREAVDTAQLRPMSPNYVAFSKRLNLQVSQVLTGRQPRLPRDLADQLTRALQGR